MKPQFNLNITFLLFFFLLAGSESFSQYNNRDFALAGYYNYTITSSFFAHPRDADFYLREQYQSIDFLSNFSFDLRYRVIESLFVGIAAGYLKSTAVFTEVEGISQYGSVALRAEDAYEFIPLELTAIYLVPFSTDQFKFFMGGGIGAYFGNSLRNINGVGVNTIEREYDIGIHVLVGMDYLIKDYLAVRGQMVFRDPEFEMKSEYQSPSVVVEEETVVIRHNTFYSKVNVDGIVFSLGLVFLF